MVNVLIVVLISSNFVMRNIMVKKIDLFTGGDMPLRKPDQGMEKL
jgi:hypothetical protein